MRIVMICMAVVILAAGCSTIKDNVRKVGQPSSFTSLDTNNDGVVSKQESQANEALMQHFGRLDTNHDGTLSIREYRAGTTNLAKVDMKTLDLNHDGVVSEREAQAMPVSLNKVFNRVDADNDGNISQTEYAAAQTNLLQGLKFADLDSDHDGVLSQSETKTIPTLNESFDRIDVNEDGLIGKDEFKSIQSH